MEVIITVIVIITIITIIIAVVIVAIVEVKLFIAASLYFPPKFFLVTQRLKVLYN